MPELHVDESPPDYNFQDSFTAKLTAAAEAQNAIAPAAETEPEPTEPADQETQLEPTDAPTEPETDPEVEPEGQPRNADGTFAAKDDGERLYADRYRTVEDLEKAVLEKEQFIARQGTELGELRKLSETLEQLPQHLQEAVRPRPQHDWEGLIESNPAQAAQIALAEGNQFALQQAVEAWDELAPGAPMVWAQNQQMQEELRQLRQATQDQVQPLEERYARTQAEQAYAAFAKDHPDIDALRDTMVTIAQQTPQLEQWLKGSPEDQLLVLDHLYMKAQAQTQTRNQGTLASAQAEADAAQAQEAKTAKENAAVATQSKTADTTPRPTTPQQQFLDGFREQIKQRNTIQSGITTD